LNLLPKGFSSRLKHRMPPKKKDKAIAPGELRPCRRHTNGPNSEDDYRTAFQRDRDRVLYSSSFRRLAEVTQVVAANSGYVFHNRLTHSLQVAQVGRRLAEKLNQIKPDSRELLDPDVVEAACLAHDLGHPPFGHIAEKTLNELSKKIGGFEGNAQSFRIVTRLTSRSPNHGGLDLTAATLAAILKYPWFRGGNTDKPKKWGAYDSERRDFNFASQLSPAKNQRTIEAELMDWADDITYSVHDLEDFFRAARMPLHLLAQRDPRERNTFFDNVFERRKNDNEFKCKEDLKEAFTDLLLATFPITGAYNGSSGHRSSLRNFIGKLIGRYSDAASIVIEDGRMKLCINPDLRLEVTMLKELTWTYVIEAPSLASQQYGQKKVVSDLYEIYSKAAKSKAERAVFPAFYRERLETTKDESEVKRIPLDLIASMTESQAVAIHRRLTGQSHSSGLDDILT
jgi:dGTPase